MGRCMALWMQVHMHMHMRLRASSAGSSGRSSKLLSRLWASDSLHSEQLLAQSSVPLPHVCTGNTAWSCTHKVRCTQADRDSHIDTTMLGLWVCARAVWVLGQCGCSGRRPRELGEREVAQLRDLVGGEIHLHHGLGGGGMRSISAMAWGTLRVRFALSRLALLRQATEVKE